MAYQVSWHVFGRVLLIVGSDTLSLADFQHSIQTAIEMIMADGQAPYIHIIHDMHRRTDLTPDFMKLQPVQASLEKLIIVQNLGWLLMVDDKPHHVLKLLTSIATQNIGAKYHIFDNLDQAWAFLMSEDPTLHA